MYWLGVASLMHVDQNLFLPSRKPYDHNLPQNGN
jgi:hypothetical protein